MCLSLLVSSPWCLCVMLRSLWCCGKSAGSPSFSVAPPGIQGRYCFPCQWSESGKTEIGPLGSTLKSQNTGRTFHLPLPSRGRGSELGVFSWSYCTALEGDGVWQVSAMDFPTCPNAPLFSIALTWGAVTFQLAFEVLTKTIYGSYTIYSC